MSNWIRKLLGPQLPLPEGPLVACRRCHARAVVPVAWEEYDDEHWWMRLRCGECGHRREAIVHDDDARRYGRSLDAGQIEIEAAVARLEREQMARQADAFRTALERDLIDVGDFARRR